MEYKYRDKQVKLHGIFQMSTVLPPSNMLGGHTGGVIAYPVAVIEYENGDLEQVSPNEIVGGFNPMDEKKKDEIFEEAMERSRAILGCDPAYYGEEGWKEVEKQVSEMGYDPKDIFNRGE